MMKIANSTKNQPRLKASSLKNGNTSEVENDPWAELDQRDAGKAGNDGLDAHARAAGESVGCLLFGDFQIVVVKADQAETERDHSTTQT